MAHSAKRTRAPTSLEGSHFDAEAKEVKDQSGPRISKRRRYPTAHAAALRGPSPELPTLLDIGSVQSEDDIDDTIKDNSKSTPGLVAAEFQQGSIPGSMKALKASVASQLQSNMAGRVSRSGFTQNDPIDIESIVSLPAKLSTGTESLDQESFLHLSSPALSLRRPVPNETAPDSKEGVAYFTLKKEMARIARQITIATSKYELALLEKDEHHDVELDINKHKLGTSKKESLTARKEFKVQGKDAEAELDIIRNTTKQYIGSLHHVHRESAGGPRIEEDEDKLEAAARTSVPREEHDKAVEFWKGKARLFERQLEEKDTDCETKLRVLTKVHELALLLKEYEYLKSMRLALDQVKDLGKRADTLE